MDLTLSERCHSRIIRIHRNYARLKPYFLGNSPGGKGQLFVYDIIWLEGDLSVNSPLLYSSSNALQLSFLS